MMLFKAESCNVSTPITLEAQYSAVRLNFYGYSREIYKIQFDISYGDQYTYYLTVNPPVKVGTTRATATPFFILLPSNTGATFSATVSSNVLTPEDPKLHYVVGDDDYGEGTSLDISYFGPAPEIVFSGGTCINMVAQDLTPTWAPVNCGYDEDDYKYGKLYQWGRKYGFGYSKRDADWPDKTGGEQTLLTGPIAAEDEVSTAFYKMTTPNPTGTVVYDWLDPVDHTRWNIGNEANNPCPDGWRVPTRAEMVLLQTNHSDWTTHNGQNGRWFSGLREYSAEGVPRVFLPAAGQIARGGSCSGSNTWGGYYVSGRPSSHYVQFLEFYSTVCGMNSTPSVASAFSVRCVEE